MIERVHHIGIAVRSLEDALRFYCDTLGLAVHQQAVEEEQGLRLALLTVGSTEIELLEPLGPDTPIGRFLERRGEGLHHLCFQTDDIEKEVAGLKALGVALVEEPRPGVVGRICFLHPRAASGVLVELAQLSE